jgi:hypothetical protein
LSQTPEYAENYETSTTYLQPERSPPLVGCVNAMQFFDVVVYGSGYLFVLFTALAYGKSLSHHCYTFINVSSHSH